MPQYRVLQPITITAIDRTLKGNKLVATRVYLTYCLQRVENDTEFRETSSSPLEAFPNLSFTDDRLLDRFIALGVRPGIASDLAELSSYSPKNKAVILTTGPLARLLQCGIGPVEAWTFLLNHGAARRAVVLNPVGPNPSDSLRAYKPWASGVQKRKLLDDAIERCSQAARALNKLQSVDMAKALLAHGYVQSPTLEEPPSTRLRMNRIPASEANRIGPHPALAPQRTKALIAELEWIADELKTYRSVFKQPRHRPADPHAAQFCRDWYALAIVRAGNPLYTQGAALYSLIISKATASSFKELCRRARRQHK
jgi:hypothetical protein